MLPILGKEKNGASFSLKSKKEDSDILVSGEGRRFCRRKKEILNWTTFEKEKKKVISSFFGGWEEKEEKDFHDKREEHDKKGRKKATRVTFLYVVRKERAQVRATSRKERGTRDHPFSETRGKRENKKRKKGGRMVSAQ